MDFLVLDIKFNLCKKYFTLREIDLFVGYGMCVSGDYCRVAGFMCESLF